MKLLPDQDAYALTVRFLAEAGHDVVTVAELYLARATDIEIWAAAGASKRILVTRDSNHGNLVLVRASGSGVIWFRRNLLTCDSQQPESHSCRAGRLLVSYSAEELAAAFVVVEPNRHRLRKRQPPPEQSEGCIERTLII
ncbi:DUF5615 family PIN-like protein [Rubidibacter lacunae]|uniref:DUF5615 family PIN-like protein n=1 Tax=Rubidibacter lacunae TaxID=582514 RepID=UPI0008FEDF58|nr:DUF5615 family PIN-like protein [Rubidibacter lacunae]